MKKLCLVLCLLLCFATAGFAVDPFKTNEGGFGPKIKGFQLGAKPPALKDLFTLLAGDVLENSFTLVVANRENGRMRIEFSLEGGKLKTWEITEAEGTFLQYKDKKLKLGEFLDEIQKGLAGASFSSNRRSIISFSVNNDDRINSFEMDQLVFKPGNLSNQEFLQAFINAYGIPKLTPSSQSSKNLEYRNLSEGWELFVYTLWYNISVSPIVSEAAFD